METINVLIRSRASALVLALCAGLFTPAVTLAPTLPLAAPTALADDGDGDGGDVGDWGPTIHIGGRGGCFGRLGLCLGGLRTIPGAALRPLPPPGPAPRVGPRGTWP
jgi:hypothetical protein